METYTCKEYINIENAKKMVMSNVIDVELRPRLKRMIKDAKQKGYQEMTFKVVDKVQSRKIGRLYPSKGVSLQCLPRDVRKVLAYENYIDLDIKNCHPVLLYQLFEKYDLKHAHIKYYCENREEVIQSIIDQSEVIDRDTAKEIITSLINGKKIQAVENTHNIKLPPAIYTYKEEIENGIEKIKGEEKYKLLWKFAELKKATNQNGVFISYVLQEIEREIMTKVINTLKDYEYEVSTIIHDGCLIKATEIPQDIINEIQQKVQKQTMYEIELVVKRMDDYNEDKLWKENEDATEEGEDIVSIFTKWLKDNNIIRMTDLELYKRYDDTPYAVYKPQKEILHSFQTYLQCSDYKHFYECIKSNTYAKSPMRYIKHYIEEVDDIHYPFLETNKSYVGFLDGVFNIITQTFTEKHDVDSSILVRKLHNVEYKEMITKETSTWDKVLDYQLEGQDMKLWFMGMIGRLMFPVGKLDNWELIFTLRGHAGSGKSTVMNVIREFFDKQNISYISTSASSDFALEGLNKEVLMSNDLTSQLFTKIDAEVFNSMVSGEQVMINRKNKKQIDLKWETPQAYAYNKTFAVKDKGGSVNRRICEFHWNNVLEKTDTTLEKKLKSEVPSIFLKCIKAYHILIQEIGTNNFWDITKERVPVLCEIRDENAGGTDNLACFLNEGRDTNRFWVEKLDGEITPLEKFKKAYSNYVRFKHGTTADKFDDNCDAALLKKRGFKIEKKWLCRSCNNIHKKGCCDNHKRRSESGAYIKVAILDMKLHDNNREMPQVYDFDDL